MPCVPALCAPPHCGRFAASIACCRLLLTPPPPFSMASRCRRIFGIEMRRCAAGRWPSRGALPRLEPGTPNWSLSLLLPLQQVLLANGRIIRYFLRLITIQNNRLSGQSAWLKSTSRSERASAAATNAQSRRCCASFFRHLTTSDTMRARACRGVAAISAR